MSHFEDFSFRKEKIPALICSDWLGLRKHSDIERCLASNPKIVNYILLSSLFPPTLRRARQASQLAQLLNYCQWCLFIRLRSQVMSYSSWKS